MFRGAGIQNALDKACGVVYARAYRNIRIGNWAEDIEDSADSFEVFIGGLVADAGNIIGFENDVAVGTDVEYTADSLQARAFPSP